MIAEILVLPHSHYDHGYVHPPAAERALQERWFGEAVALLEADPEAAWCAEVTTAVADWLDHADAPAVARARRLVAAGRLGIGALRWNTTPLSDAGELRWLAAGAVRMREQLGDPCRTAFQHDVNGIPWPAADLLPAAGIDTLVMGINVHQGGCAVGRHRAFRWHGPAGGSLMVYNGDIYSTFSRLTGDGSEAAMRAGWASYLPILAASGSDLPWIMLTHTMKGCEDCNPPDTGMAALVRRWNEARIGPPARLVTPEALRAALLALPADRVGSQTGDWTDFWNFGAGSSAIHTAIARRARRRLREAEAIAPSAVDARLAGRVREDVAAFHEHTWGSAVSCSATDSLEPEVQWSQKAAQAATAASLADLLRRDALHHLSGNPRQQIGVAGVVVANPGDRPRRCALRIPTGWRQPGWRLHEGTWQGIDVQLSRGLPPPGPVVELPARSWRALSWADLDTAGAEPGADDVLRAADCAIALDAEGRISALRAADGMNLLAGPIDLVHETVAPGTDKPRYAYFANDQPAIQASVPPWRGDWPAVRATSSGGAWRIERHGAARTVVRELLFPGWHACRLEATTHPDLPGIDLRLVGRLRDTTHPESWYLALPLALPAGWRCHFDTAGCPVELDAGQLPGASRDWVTVDRWIAMHHGGRGVVLACPDAPLAMPAGFAFGRHRQAIPRDADPLLLAWPMNTYWQTNFRIAQAGPIDLRWHLRPMAGFTASAADAAADDADGLVVHPLAALPDRRQGTLPARSGQHG